MQAELNISWTELTKFVGQLNHDLRNHLNAIELQSAFLSEVAGGEEAKQEVRRLREMTAEMCAHLQRLSVSFTPVRPATMRYLAREFVEDLQAKLAREEPERAAEIDWEYSLGEAALEMDPHLLQEAFLELFRNALVHGRAEGVLTFEARRVKNAIEFSLREPKSEFDCPTTNWGGQPLEHLRSGHYGLGLFRARSIFEAHHGTFSAHFNPAASTLVTSVSLPSVP